MNKLNDAWQALQKLPPEEQDRVAEALLDYASEASQNFRLTEEQVAEVERRLNDKDAPVLTQEEFRARVRKLIS